MRSVGPLLLWSTVGFTLLLSAARPVSTNDLHIYLAMGRWMAEQGQLMEVEAFTWTIPGTPFVNGTWGFSALSWQLHEAFGLRGLQLLNGALVGLAVWLSARSALLLGADRRAAAIGALYAFALLFQNTTVRGQTFVFPLFAAMLWWSMRARSPAGSLLVGVLGGCLWGALHGSFPAGLAALGLLAASRLRGPGGAWMTPALVCLGLAVGVCIGPYGPSIWVYVLENGSLPRERNFLEWASPTLRSFEGARFYASLVLWGLLAAASLRRGRLPQGLLPVLAFAALACTGIRFVAWFGLLSAPFFAAALPLSTDRGLPRPLVRAVEGVALVLWTLFLIRGLQPRDRILSWDTPVELLEALPHQGRILNPPELGGAIVVMRPELLIGHDIRTWIYDDAAWSLYLELSEGAPGWDQRLQDLKVDHLLLTEDFHGEGLLPAALASPAWRVVSRTEQGALLTRVSPR